MRTIHVLAVAIILCVFRAGSAESVTFEYRANGEVVGSETARVAESDSTLIVRGTVDAVMNGTTINATLLTTYDSESLSWLTYSQNFDVAGPRGKQKGNITASSENGSADIHIEMEGAKLDKSFPIDEHPYILERNFVHHYLVFLRLIGAEGWFASPTERSFSSVAPGQLTTVTGALDPEVTAAVGVLNGEEIGTIAFRLSLSGIPTTLTVRDDTYELLRAKTASGIDVIREGFEPAEDDEPDWFEQYADRVTETTGSFRSGNLDIPYTLTLPSGDDDERMGVVLVHGSGPNDRDGTVGPNTPLKDIAFALAAAGAVVIRYDKRTFVDPTSIAPEDVTMETVVMADARAAVDELRTHDRVDDDAIVVIGHSLGGRAAPTIATDVDASHVIMLAGSALSIIDTLERQIQFLAGTKGLDDDGVAAERAQGTALVAPLRDRSTDPTILVLGAPASFWWDIEDLDPIPVLTDFDGLALVIRGDRDYQVVEEDTARWQSAIDERDKKGDIVYDVPGANHLLIRTRGEVNAGDVYKPGHVDELAIEKMVSFLGLGGKNKRKRGRR